MTIALVAHDSKKELMVQFCTAYRHILAQHHLIATGTTGRLVEENTGLSVQKFLPGGHGGGRSARGAAGHARGARRPRLAHHPAPVACVKVKKLHKNTPADLVGLRGRFVYCGLLSSS